VGQYFRTPHMQTGGPFRCYNCGNLLVSQIDGVGYSLELKCPRCKAEIKVKMMEPVPDEAVKKIQAVATQK